MHCWAMCGGIIVALSAGIPPSPARTPWRHALLITGFSAGRILSYAVAGILAGAAGSLALAQASRLSAYLALQLAAALILILVGLHLAGWFPRLAALDMLGAKLWRWLQPLGRPFLPVDNLPKALVVGALWGWLPCGLVYSALLWTTAQADPLFGGVAMLAFGLGTLPGMIGAGLVAQRAAAPRRRLVLRRAAAVLLIAIAAFSATAALRHASLDAEHVHH